MCDFERFRRPEPPDLEKSPSGRPRTDARREAVVRVLQAHGYNMDASTDQGGRIRNRLAMLRSP